jgi:hypothetical protein
VASERCVFHTKCSATFVVEEQQIQYLCFEAVKLASAGRRQSLSKARRFVPSDGSEAVAHLNDGAARTAVASGVFGLFRNTSQNAADLVSDPASNRGACFCGRLEDDIDSYSRQPIRYLKVITEDKHCSILALACF